MKLMEVGLRSELSEVAGHKQDELLSGNLRWLLYGVCNFHWFLKISHQYMNELPPRNSLSSEVGGSVS